MMQWLIENKEWLFSGIGVAILSIILSVIIKNKKKDKGDVNISQVMGKDVKAQKGNTFFSNNSQENTFHDGSK